MEASIRRFTNKVLAEMESETKSNAVYQELKKQIEETKRTTQTSIMIADSAWMSADQIHHWFPELEVSWKNGNIHIRW